MSRGTTQEIEVKILEIDPISIEEKIKNLGAILRGNWLMKTIIFDYPDGRLLSQKSYVRLRTEGDRIVCTYKSPLEQSTVKVMQEYEVEVKDFLAMQKILEGIGLVSVNYFEKKRKHYVKGNLIFDIDTLPQIPTFLEIEATSEKEIDKALKDLNIPKEKANSMGPKELLAHYGIQLEQVKELKFSTP